jgi:hypothetical protein
MLVVAMLLGGGLAFVGCEGQAAKPVPNAGDSNAAGSKSTARKVAPQDNQPIVTSELFGKNEKGDDIVRYNLRNSHGMKVSVLNLGAIITSVEVPDRDGKFANVTLNFPDASSRSTAPNTNWLSITDPITCTAARSV